MKNRPSVSRLFWVVPGALSALGPVCCRGEWDAEKYLVYGLGPVSLRPQLEVGETYDSNIFYAEDNPVEDWVTSVRPGLSVVYGHRAENFISIRYTLDASLYAERDDLNNIGHLLTHQTRLKLGRWTLQATDSFTSTRMLLGGGFAYIQRRVGLTTLTDLWRADFELSPRVVVGGKFGFDWADYEEADLTAAHLYDYMTYTLGMRVGYMPSDKILVYPEFSFGQTFLDRNSPLVPEAPEVNTYSMSLGAEGEFTPKLTGMVSAGYEMREFSDDTEIPDGWVADTRVRWEMRPKTRLSVGYRHFIQVSREARAIPFTAHRPNLTVEQEFGTMGKWTAVLDAYYQFNDYEAQFVDAGPPRRLVSRQDDFIGVGARVNWRWQPWLTASAMYDFRSYSDNLISFPDYELHRISIRLAAGY